MFVATVDTIEEELARYIEENGKEAIPPRIAFILQKHEQGEFLTRLDYILAGLFDPRFLAGEEGKSTLFMNQMLTEMLCNKFDLDMQSLYQQVKSNMDGNKDDIEEVSAFQVDPWDQDEEEEEVKPSYSEEQFLRKAYSHVKEYYFALKKETSSFLEFIPRKKYIALKRKKNFGYIIFKKHVLSLIVLESIETTKQVISRYDINSLPEKSQKFWGYPSCEIEIDHGDGIQEVAALLKQIAT